MSENRRTNRIAAAIAFWLALWVSASADERPAELVLGKVHAITTDKIISSPAEVSRRLRTLLEEHPRDAIILYALAEAARREGNALELARALVELPDETPDSDLAASHVLASWSHLGDLNLIARAVERQCRFIATGRRPRSAKDRFRTL